MNTYVVKFEDISGTVTTVTIKSESRVTLKNDIEQYQTLYPREMKYLRSIEEK